MKAAKAVKALTSIRHI